MGITERREREKAEMRQRILDAARDLFASEGYEKVTMRRLAEAIEYSPTTIYHHFEDKDDVVEALCVEDFGRLFAALSDDALPADPIERIRQLGRAYCRFGLEHPNHYRFMFMTEAREKHPHEPDLPGERSFGLLLDAVTEAIRHGRFRQGDPVATAQVLWASLHGAVALLITKQPEAFPLAPPAADLVEQTIENGLRGFGVDAPARA